MRDARGTSYECMKKEVLESEYASEWIKKATLVLESRDVVDVMSELEILRGMFEMRYLEVLKANKVHKLQGNRYRAMTNDNK